MAGFVCADEINIVTESNPPLQLQEDGKATGFAVELLESILDASELYGDITFYPWARAYKIALEQPNTLIFSMRRMPARESNFLWAQPVFVAPFIPAAELQKKQSTLTFLCKVETSVEADTLKELARYSLAAPRGDFVTEQLMSMVDWPPSSLVQTPSYTGTLELLKNDRVKLALAYGDKTDGILLRYGYDPKSYKVCFEAPIARYDQYFAFSLGTNKSTIEEFKIAFQRLIDSGEYEKIHRRWFLQ